MKVNVDEASGFCFGVQNAVDRAEEEIEKSGPLYSLGDIVHNTVEVERLGKVGLKTIDKEAFESMKHERVFIRAHGEPPETYEQAKANNIELIDATCPVVLKLQERIRKFYQKGYQVLIYGKVEHPEVIGLNGQCHNNAIVMRTPVLSQEDKDRLDFSKPTVLFSQTTKDTKGFAELKANLESEFKGHQAERKFEADTSQEIFTEFLAKDTICRQVSNRDEKLIRFSKDHEAVVFVAGKKSSNGKVLFGVCQEANPRTYFAENESDIKPEWFKRPDGSQVELVGVCGATSTPMWLMRQMADYIQKTYSEQ
jgi:4-hydroxy-3-methylbut-2-enyl diphosphate reductase